MEHFRQKFRRHGVVARCDVEKFAGGQLYSAIQSGVESLARNLIQSKTRIGAGDRFKKFPTAIRRAAIEDDCFPSGECLFEQRIDSGLEKLPRVERRQQDGNARSVHVARFN